VDTHLLNPHHTGLSKYSPAKACLPKNNQLSIINLKACLLTYYQLTLQKMIFQGKKVHKAQVHKSTGNKSIIS